jgi:hypothetical protein
MLKPIRSKGFYHLDTGLRLRPAHFFTCKGEKMNMTVKLYCKGKTYVLTHYLKFSNFTEFRFNQNLLVDLFSNRDFVDKLKQIVPDIKIAEVIIFNLHHKLSSKLLRLSLKIVDEHFKVKGRRIYRIPVLESDITVKKIKFKSMKENIDKKKQTCIICNKTLFSKNIKSISNKFVHSGLCYQVAKEIKDIT